MYFFYDFLNMTVCLAKTPDLNYLECYPVDNCADAVVFTA